MLKKPILTLLLACVLERRWSILAISGKMGHTWKNSKNRLRFVREMDKKMTKNDKNVKNAKNDDFWVFQKCIKNENFFFHLKSRFFAFCKKWQKLINFPVNSRGQNGRISGLAGTQKKGPKRGPKRGVHFWHAFCHFWPFLALFDTFWPIWSIFWHPKIRGLQKAPRE